MSQEEKRNAHDSTSTEVASEANEKQCACLFCKMNKKTKLAILIGCAAIVALTVMLLIFLITPPATPDDNLPEGPAEGETGGEDNLPEDEPDPLRPFLADPVNDNYRTFYQIFVGSFSDSNGDGIGDIRGIINRFDYLNDGDMNNGRDLGVQGIWLSPIFESPSYHKYDAIDYYNIDPQFGTMEDLEELIALCHERNVIIILDLVINHSSNHNEWFYEFCQARIDGDTDNRYYDFYTCVDKNEMVPGRTYTGIDGTDLVYECNFSTQMPEFNYDNPVVKEEMLSLAKYYLDLGVDGFRFDAVKYIYYGDTEASVDFWKWYMSELTAYKPDIYCVGECWSAESEVLEYYEALNCFDFTISQSSGVVARAAKGSNIANFTKYVENYQDSVQQANADGIPMFFLSNHDMNRIAGAFMDPNNAKMAANLYLLAPGSPFIYYGEELGMKGSRGGEYTDANRRLAMLWGDGDTIQNPEGSTYKKEYQIKTTVKTQLIDKTSMLRHYSKLINIRNRYEAIARGDYNAVSSDNFCFGGFYVEYKDEILGIFHNTSDEEIVMDLSTCEGLDGHTFVEILDYIGGEAKLEGSILTIPAFTSVILQ